MLPKLTHIGAFYWYVTRSILGQYSFMKKYSTTTRIGQHPFDSHRFKGGCVEGCRRYWFEYSLPCVIVHMLVHVKPSKKWTIFWTTKNGQYSEPQVSLIRSQQNNENIRKIRTIPLIFLEMVHNGRLILRLMVNCRLAIE